MKNKILLSVKYNENKPNDPYAQKKLGGKYKCNRKLPKLTSKIS